MSLSGPSGLPAAVLPAVRGQGRCGFLKLLDVTRTTSEFVCVFLSMRLCLPQFNIRIRGSKAESSVSLRFDVTVTSNFSFMEGTLFHRSREPGMGDLPVHPVPRTPFALGQGGQPHHPWGATDGALAVGS